MFSVLDKLRRDVTSANQKQREEDERRAAEAAEAYRVLVYSIVDGEEPEQPHIVEVLNAVGKSLETLERDVQTVVRVKNASQAWSKRTDYDRRVEQAYKARDERAAEMDAELKRRQAALDKLKADYEVERSKLSEAVREAEAARSDMRREVAAVLTEHGENIGCPADLLESIDKARQGVWQHDADRQKVPTHDLPQLPPDGERRQCEAELSLLEAQLEEAEKAYNEMLSGGYRVTGEQRSIVAGLKHKVMRARGNLAPWTAHQRHAEEQARRDATYPKLHAEWKAYLEQLESLVPDWRALPFD